MAFLEDEEKQTLLDRYFDIEWIGNVSDLQCVRCRRVAIDHYVSSCQHIFCKICHTYKDEDQPTKCPKCQKCITQPDKKDFSVEVKIHQLKIFCPNKKFGCKHEDQLRNILAHLSSCANKREAVLPGRSPAINIMDAVNKMVENAVKEKFNQLERNASDIDSKVNTLTERIASMDKKIEDLIVGMDMVAKKCAEESQSLKAQLELINQTITMNESLHQKEMEKISNVESIRKNIASMTQEVTGLRDKQSEVNTQKAKTCKWIITDWKKTIGKVEWTIESGPFTFIDYDNEIRAKMEKKEGVIAIYLQFNDGNTVNRNLNNIGFTRCKYIIKHRSNIPKTKDIIYESDLWFYDCFSHSNWVFGQGVSSLILSPQYMKNNSITIIISLEPPSIDRSLISNNGILMWTVDNYKTRKQEHLYCDILSPSFYTSPQGYRVKARLLMNDKGPMLVEVNFLTGEHDGFLSIDFPHRTTVTLYNQDLPLKNLVKTELRGDVKVYTIELERSYRIERDGFLKHDSLLLKIVIEPV